MGLVHCPRPVLREPGSDLYLSLLVALGVREMPVPVALALGAAPGLWTALVPAPAHRSAPSLATTPAQGTP